MQYKARGAVSYSRKHLYIVLENINEQFCVFTHVTFFLTTVAIRHIGAQPTRIDCAPLQRLLIVLGFYFYGSLSYGQLPL